MPAVFKTLAPPKPKKKFRVVYLLRRERLIDADDLAGAEKYMQHVAGAYDFGALKLVSIYDVACLPTWADIVMSAQHKEGVDSMPTLPE